MTYAREEHERIRGVKEKGTASQQQFDQAQATDGPSEGAQVLTHPGEQLSDGMRVEAR